MKKRVILMMLIFVVTVSIVLQCGCTKINLHPGLQRQSRNSIGEQVTEGQSTGNGVVDFDVLWIVVPYIDADTLSFDNEIVHTNSRMSEEEIEYYKDYMSEKFEKSVESISNNAVDINITTDVYKKTVYTLELDYNCLSCRESFDDYYENFDEYDTVICTTRLYNAGNPVVDVAWLGLADIQVYDGAFTFCQVQVEDDYDYLYYERRNNPYPEETWIHEWIHTLEPVFNQVGFYVPNPDDMDEYGYYSHTRDGMNGYMDFYADILTARVYDDYYKEYVGISREDWNMLNIVKN